MRKFNNVSWSRMVLALAATLLVGGSGMALAVGPNPAYVPQSSVLIGPATVAKSTSVNYVLRVTFVNAGTVDFPPTMGASFSAAVGAFSPTMPGLYTAPSSGSRDVVRGAFSQNGVQTTASRVIALQ